ncbi:Pentatricopeptide repeat-containing protein [Nymphaea thermarum]|nr:Pentatricopeptide repeat-containing protein [Nymphaea thermarum]
MHASCASPPLPPDLPPPSPEAKRQCLKLLRQYNSVRQLRQIHAYMLRTGVSDDAFSASRLLYFSCLADLSYASGVHAHIPHRNTFSWNTLIRAHADSNSPLAKQEAILLYDRMLRDGCCFDKFSFPFVLKACAFLFAASEGLQLHAQILKAGLGGDVFVNNSLIHMYATCGSMPAARVLFDKMPERSLVSWNVVIEGYVLEGQFDEALQLFKRMQLDGSGNSAGTPDRYTMQSVVSACGGLGALALGMWAHCSVVRKGLQVGVLMENALLEMYWRCGCLVMARQVFDSMIERDVSTFNAMIFGLAMHGHGKEAIEVFAAMKVTGVKPNSITFVGILSACSHAGMIDDGRKYFECMAKDYGIEPRIEHYGCMVDLLGRAGCVNEAAKLISNMPVEPDAAIWRSMLNACCRNNAGLEYSELAAKRILELEDDSSGAFVLLSKAYASRSRWFDVGAVRKVMTGRGITKQPGCSSIEIDGIVNEFLAGDSTHPQSEQIYKKLDLIDDRLNSVGYVPDRTQAVMVDEYDHVKGDSLRLHSERLAIAFGLLNRKQNVPIRIMKNLRVCGDCHHAAKLISDLFNVEIIMRDRVRFHHFKAGACSCMDYW